MNYKTSKQVDKVEELLESANRIVGGESAVAAFAPAFAHCIATNPLLDIALWTWDRWDSWRNKDNLRQRKETLLMKAIKTRDAVIKELTESTGKAQRRIDELTEVNVALKRAIEKLSQDLS